MTTAGAPPYVLGVDGGGTKTRAAVLAADGTLLGEGRGGPANPHFAPGETVRRSLRQAVDQALAQAGIARGEVVLAVGSFAGGWPLSELAPASGVAPWALVPEHEVWMASALLSGEGAVILSGTGAFEWARGPRGAHRTDGLGMLLGDEGSAYWLAREALVAVGRASDGRGLATALSQVLREATGGDDAGALGRWLYRADGRVAPRHEVAALAPVVTRLAQAGDRVASAICRRAAQHLWRGAATCIRRSGLADRAFPLVLAGGVLAAPAVREPLVAMLAQAYPRARAVRPRFGPAVAAALLALSRLGVVWDDALAARLERAARSRGGTDPGGVAVTAP
jgi:N-acetylglucosamine kinase-like BadF-type ATPase